jgi:lipopolysaccharide/colanic/teichoic acid biosynthesis glycosyltransferase
VSFYEKFGKRIFDLVVSTLLLIILSPIVIVSFFAVWTSLGMPLLFKQKRIGLHGREFTIMKLRTMHNTEPNSDNLASDMQRLSKTGHVLRALSIDELPTLLNVIGGSMSLVGPRPLLPEYLPLYSQEQLKRHHVKPGITGLAQVNGRNSISWNTKFKFDLQYVDTLSLRLDIKIIIKTIFEVAKRNGVFSNESATMPPFNGC